MPVSFDPDVFTIYAVATSNETAEALELGIYEEIEKIINDPIEDKELQKIKNQKLMEFYQNMETINGRSNNVGNYELFFGDYKKLYEAPANYNKVTIEDVKRVAKEYLNEDNRTFGIVSAKK
jgi:predicted Zn-dependent peptidase